MKTITYALVLLLAGLSAAAQDTAGIFTRLQAISHGRVDYFNTDGMEISSHRVPGEFTVKNLQKSFKPYRIKADQLTTADSALGYPNYYVDESYEAAPGIKQYIARYYIGHEGSLYALTFMSSIPPDRAFHRAFAKLVLEGSIPLHVYVNPDADSLNFAGRNIFRSKVCRFMSINNLQCPYYGQMNWSVHRDAASAAAAVKAQYDALTTRKTGKFIAADTVDVILEGTPVKALKATYDVKGVSGLLVGMSGAKTLTVYFVSAPVRNNHVSCAMSFWNNDSVNADGLPPLLAEVMRLGKP